MAFRVVPSGRGYAVVNNSHKARGLDNHLWLPRGSVGLGGINGRVIEDGDGVPYCTVGIYYRATKKLIATVLTTAGGYFRYDSGLTLDSEAVFAIAFDLDGGVSYNAILYDKLTANADQEIVVPNGFRLGGFGEPRIYPETYNVFDPSRKGANFTLSNSNQTVVCSSGSTVAQLVQTTGATSTIPFYFEASLDVQGGTGTSSQSGIGVAKSTVSVNNYVGQGTDSVAFWARTSVVYSNATAQASGLTTAVQGDVIGIAFDPTSGKFWASVNGVWQNNRFPGFNDGAVSLYTISVTGSPSWAPTVTPYNSSNQITLRTRAKDFSYKVPPGFRAGLY